MTTEVAAAVPTTTVGTMGEMICLAMLVVVMRVLLGVELFQPPQLLHQSQVGRQAPR